MNTRRWEPPAHPVGCIDLKGVEGLGAFLRKKQVHTVHPHTISPLVFEHKIHTASEGSVSVFPFCVLTLQIMSLYHAPHTFGLFGAPTLSLQWRGRGARVSPQRCPVLLAN